MRKRMVIGVLAIIAIGVSVYVASQPKEGSVEWHKREYSTLIDRIYGRRVGLVDRAWQFIERKTGLLKRRNSRQQQLELARKAEVHRLALLKLGYLEQRSFLISNRPMNMVQHELMEQYNKRIARDWRWWQVLVTGTNEFMIIALSEDMPKWEKLVREVDALQNGK